MTIDELRALPVGPEFSFIKKRIHGEMVNVPVAPDVVAHFVEADEPEGYSDETGTWKIGRYRDGSCFRQRVR
jgi:hypothetical protein